MEAIYSSETSVPDNETGVVTYELFAQCLRFEVLSAVLLKSHVLWHLTPCRLAGGAVRFPGCLTLKMKAFGFFETAVTTCPTTQLWNFLTLKVY